MAQGIGTSGLHRGVCHGRGSQEPLETHELEQREAERPWMQRSRGGKGTRQFRSSERAGRARGFGRTGCVACSSAQQ